MEPLTLTGLAQEALPVVSEIATRLGIKNENPDFAEFGGWLCTLAKVLPSLSLSPDQRHHLDKNVGKILDHVEKACAGPPSLEAERHPTLTIIATSKAADQAYFFWRAPISAKRERDIKRNLTKYISSSPELKSLLRLIEESSTLKGYGAADTISDEDSILAGKVEDAPDYPSHLNRDLYNSLRLHMCCCVCKTGKHLARLRLNPREEKQDTHVRFEVLFSVPSHTLRTSSTVEWRETKILIPSKNHRKKQARFTAQQACTEQASHKGQIQLNPGQLCSILSVRESSLISLAMQHPALKILDDDETSAPKVKSVNSRSLYSVLQDRKMSRKAKCILAYTLAKSVWQYYGSDWMNTPWTHENIHFLDDHDPRNQTTGKSVHCCRPYLVPKFEKAETDIPEFCEGDSVMHRYPKVLALGILLIEIAKGEILEACKISHSYDNGSINEYFISAWSSLTHGILGEDDDYTTYKDAVKKCLDFDLFVNAPYVPGDSRPEESLKERRAILYAKVVSPLRKLLEGTGWLSELYEIKQEPISQSAMKLTSKANISSTQATQDLGNYMEALSITSNHGMSAQASFLAEKPKWTPDSWLRKMDTINRLMSERASLARPMKIAVLDTGCSLNAPIFSMEGQEARMKNHWKDWVDGSPQPKDTNGHGTKIVSLLLRIAPDAEIFVARVAKDHKSLSKADEVIAQAIQHAATEWNVDIVSMSFGFSDEVETIRDAIHRAEAERNYSIVFFAAAANDGSNTTEMFPAFMNSVISIRGADPAGDFIPLYDPETPAFNRGKYVYGTLGQDVPCGWPDEDPSMLMSGCSIATPMAAGIAALIMQCVASAPDRFGERYQKKIRSTRGISEVLFDMSVDQGRNRLYVAPWKLFMNNGEPKLNSIGAALNRLQQL